MHLLPTATNTTATAVGPESVPARSSANRLKASQPNSVPSWFHCHAEGAFHFTEKLCRIGLPSSQQPSYNGRLVGASTQSALCYKELFYQV